MEIISCYDHRNKSRVYEELARTILKVKCVDSEDYKLELKRILDTFPYEERIESNLIIDFNKSNINQIIFIFDYRYTNGEWGRYRITVKGTLNGYVMKVTGGKRKFGSVEDNIWDDFNVWLSSYLED